MMKKVLSFVLCFCILAVFSACSQTKEDSEKVEVVIWHRWNVAEGEGEHELQVAVDRFNASQDSVHVVLEAQPTSGFSDKVYNSVVNGVGPDIVFEFATTVCDYQDQGLLANMEEYIDTENLKNRISEELWNEAWSSGDDHLHIVPIQVTNPVLFYNKSLYDKYSLDVPQTWEQLANNSKVIFDNEKIPGFAVDSYIDLAQTLFFQNGAEYINVETSTVGFNTSICQESVKWFADAVKQGFFSSNFSSGSIDGDFNAGLLASFMGTCSYEPYILPNDFEYGVAPLPSRGTENWIPLFNRGAVVFASDKVTEKAACEFIEFFTNEENSMRWCTSIGALSPYKDSCERSDYLSYVEKSKILQVASDCMDRAGTTPPVKGSVAIRNELKQLFLHAIGDVKPVDQLFSEAEKNCNNALQK